MPLISVIIPIYNSKQYLKDCIDSILKQSFRDYELILVDDGSTDDSGAVCDYYEKHKGEYGIDIKVFHNENSGPAASRKCGVLNSSGNYICFADSDDYVDEAFLQSLKDSLLYEGENADVVTEFFTDIYDNGRHEPCKRGLKTEDEVLSISSYEEMIYEIHANNNITTGPYPKLIRKELFEGIDYHEDITIGEDYTMLLQLLRKAKRVNIVNKDLYFRHMHPGNISRGGYTERHRKALNNYFAIRNELIKLSPRNSKYIMEYHITYEMAVITAMCRNKNYDWPVIYKLQGDLRTNIKDILFKYQIPKYYKICALLISYMPHIFIVLFRIFHLITKR